MIPNRSLATIEEAHRAGPAQLRQGMRWLKMDKKKAGNPADVALAERMVAAAAADNFKEYMNLLSRPEVNALFNRGALFYKVTTAKGKR